MLTTGTEDFGQEVQVHTTDQRRNDTKSQSTEEPLQRERLTF